MRIHPIGPCTTESFKGKRKTRCGMWHYTQYRLRLSCLDCVYALRYISAESRRAISTQGDKHASDAQRFQWEVEVLKQVRLSDTRTRLRLV